MSPYAPPVVEMAWVTDAPLGGAAVRRLVIEVAGLPGGHAQARVRCRDGERVVTDTNQLFSRPGGHTSNVLMYEPTEHAVCELTLQEFDDDGPRLVACLTGGRTEPGACDPPIAPTAPADGRTLVHDVDARFEDHPIGGPESLNFGYRVRLGRDVPRISAKVTTTVRCRGEVVEELEHPLDSTFDGLAGESWVVRRVIAPARGPCELDVALAVHPPGAVHDWQVEPLGTFPVGGG